MNKNLIIKKVKQLLAQRRVVFFRCYPDAKKQQLIINAEHHLHFLENDFDRVKRLFADDFVKPLTPAPSSKYHQVFVEVYQMLVS